jgi:hypothetical protein
MTTKTITTSGGTYTNSGVFGSTSYSTGAGITMTGSNEVLINTGSILGGGPGYGALRTENANESVTNQVGGFIYGAQNNDSGIYSSAIGTVTNFGIIKSASATIGGSGCGVAMENGGAVTNNTGGTISGGGIIIQNAAGTVINSGLISGSSGYGAIALNDGGVVTNLAGAIDAVGGTYGVRIAGAAGTVTNAGTIVGGSLYGVYLTSGGAVDNQAGTISASIGGYGVRISGAGTVTNAGTITGGTNTGSAVKLDPGYVDRVIVDPGAVFIGTVDGGVISKSTLELAAGSGTITGFGSRYLNFGTIKFDASSNWTVTANATASAARAAISGAVIDGFGAGDTIGLAGFVANRSTTVSSTDFVLTNAGGTSVALHFGAPLTSFSYITGAFGTDLTALCFCAGTAIATPAGETLVEHLRPGDVVLTDHNGPRLVTWIGEGKVLATRGKRSAATPVIVAAGALGRGVPHRDLRVTKGHSLYLDEVLIPVEFLVNHRTIRWDDHAQEVHVFHVELETHDAAGGQRRAGRELSRRRESLAVPERQPELGTAGAGAVRADPDRWCRGRRSVAPAVGAGGPARVAADDG